MSKKIAVTGGAGYIGSHTLVDLIDSGYDVISIDNLSRGYAEAINGVSKITGRSIKNYEIDLCDLEQTKKIFEENRDIVGVIHFAAYKSVPESVHQPLLYFRNNISSLLNILECIQEFGIKHFVFSSSCSVYGNAKELPVVETTPFGIAESPYARTKQIGEMMCQDFAKANPEKNIILLRYFNPAGTHPSCEIGDMNKVPENVVPIITQTAIGIRESMHVFGDDYDTRDGTCIRDYIHVMDIAHAHTLAIEYCEEHPNVGMDIFNLGTGDGVTVLELLNAFEKTNQLKLNYKIGARRPGDVEKIYANNEKAKTVLRWELKYTLEDMMKTAWEWQKKIK